jgi:glutamate 5-kinase
MDWREERRRTVAGARRVVVKVGSAVLTCPEGLDVRVIGGLVDQVAGLHDRGLDIVVVSSGAVAAGRAVLGRGACACVVHKQAASAVGQSRLMHAYDEAFARCGKVSAQVLLTKDDLRSRSRFLNARNTMNELLAWRVIPVVNENDTVAVEELKFGDNDALSAMVANVVAADLIINLTSARGVFDANPQESPQARLLECIEDIDALHLASMCRGKTTAGTGGMLSKLLAARRAARLGIPTIIVSGREHLALERICAGEELGTWVRPKRTISGRKFWLAYHLDPAGVVRVDAGAAEALRRRGKSLLAAGVCEVEGQFGVGALVKVVDPQGRTVGVGLSNFKAAELRRIQGLSSSRIAEVLGGCLHPEVIHRDNFVLDETL